MLRSNAAKCCAAWRQCCAAIAQKRPSRIAYPRVLAVGSGHPRGRLTSRLAPCRANVHSLLLQCKSSGVGAMPRVSTAFKEDRRTEILEAARRCVARSGFHQTSMHDICAEAGMSPGNLYRYFPSKEAIIAAIAERDRAEVGAELGAAQSADDFFATCEALARHHLVERNADDVGLCNKIGAARRRHHRH